MKLRYSIITLYILFFTSCAIHQGEKVVRKEERVRNISNAKLYKDVVENYREYKTINFNKIKVSYEQEGKTQEFRGSIRILKDSIIWLSFSKMGIEGLRVKLTPDSIAFIDRLHKEYMTADYEYLNQRFNIELDYYLVQNILTNQLPEYRIGGDLPFFRNFKGKRSDTHYLFYSKKRRDRQYWREQRNTTGNEGSTLEILRISPDIMRLESIDIYDTQFFKLGGQQTVNLNLKYNNYKTYTEKYLFPENITTTVQRKLVDKNGETSFEKIILSIVVFDLEINKEDLSFPFKISSKYKKINE